MVITVQLSPGPASRAVLRDVLGPSPEAVLRPLHPGTDDPTLGSYFTVEVPDGPGAEQRVARLLTRLRACPEIAAAYVKPPDSMA